jgi:cytochrome c oxidase subunit 2
MKMSKIGHRLMGLAVAGAALAAGGVAFAELGQPAPWEMTLQESATPVMDNITWFHNFLLVLITVITLFVLALLVMVVIKFNARSNPVPSRTTHNTLIEVAWTLIPVLILVGIAVPSFRLLFLDKQPRLLGVDNEMVVPVNKVIRVQTTGADVIHAFAVPAFGIKIDSIPGRLNETWFKATKTGMFYGQCSELCGKDHAFMPIAVRVVSEQEFATWVEGAKKKFATNPGNSFASAGAAAQ